MLKRLFRRFNSKKSNLLNQYRSEIHKINHIEFTLNGHSDKQLIDLATNLKERARDGEALNGTIRLEAFALVKQASKRVTGLQPHDVQLAAGLALSEGKIAEMKTGEGKTLSAALPSFLFALAGKGVHVITVNDYLAQRDERDIGRIHKHLGMSVGVVFAGMNDQERQEAYGCDITYATNSEIGFDFLRDNLRFETSELVQRGQHYALVDEADSILIDEARTPLIITSADDDASHVYNDVDAIVRRMPENCFKVDLKDQSVVLTEAGSDYLSQNLNETNISIKNSHIGDSYDVRLIHYVDAALKAHKLFTKDKDYVVMNDRVVIVDTFTGRLQPDRRYSDGIHQALEAKEGVLVNPESITLSSVTYQNLFRLYEHLCGMTGTAVTEQHELMEVYGLHTVIVPTHKTLQRIDDDDHIFLTASAKYDAIVEEIHMAHKRGQPVLVGTPSVEASERIATMLEKAGFNRKNAPMGKMTFSILNAKNHANEASIISEAGSPFAITIATNMAGRGTDILLGGKSVDISSKSQVLDAGGLLVIGTERNESLRVDNQLRGRAGRQGDPGRSVFYVSLEDQLIAIFGSGLLTLATKLGVANDVRISHPLIRRAIQSAQVKREQQNRESRMNIIKYDDIINQQRQVMREMRNEFMASDDLSETLEDMRLQSVAYWCDKHLSDKTYAENWNLIGLKDDIQLNFGIEIQPEIWIREETINVAIVQDKIADLLRAKIVDIKGQIGDDNMLYAEKTALMSSVDRIWREHNANLEELKSSVGFRTIGMRDPITEFKTDAFEMFNLMLTEVILDSASMTSKIMKVT